MKKEKYIPPYRVTSTIIHYIASIMELLGQVNIQQESNLWVPEQRNHFRLQSIHATLAIEQNSLSISEMSQLMTSKTTSESKEVIEVRNAQQLYENMSSIEVKSEVDLLRGHQVLMNGLIPNAGEYRTQDIGVYQGDVVIFMAPSHKRVPELMDQLMEYVRNSEDHFLIQSSVFHYEFEFIHPFSDGNGRMGRFLQKCILNHHYGVFAYMPIESMIHRHQQQYYDAISLSHRMGESTPFIEFMLTMIYQTLSEQLDQRVLHLTLPVQKLLQRMDNGVAYTPKELMELVGLKSRSSFFNHYLKPALASERVVRVFPDQPKSRYQQYIKVW